MSSAGGKTNSIDFDCSEVSIDVASLASELTDIFLLSEALLGTSSFVFCSYNTILSDFSES